MKIKKLLQAEANEFLSSKDKKGFAGANNFSTLQNSRLQGGMPESDGNPMAESDKFFFRPYGRERQVFFGLSDG